MNHDTTPNTILGFSFDPKNGQYLGAIDIVRQDFDGRYPLPKYTVLFAPLDTPGPYQTLRINAQQTAWEVVDDFRNQRLYSKITAQPVANTLLLGQFLPDDLTLIAPPDGSGQWVFNEVVHHWQKPPAAEPVSSPQTPEVLLDWHITNLAFDLRFSEDERVAIEMAALDNPAAAMEQRLQAAQLRVTLERSRKAEYTDLKDPITRSGVEKMEALGLLAPGRAAEILDSPIQDNERY